MSHSSTQQPLELLHIDLWGPCTETSISGSSYYAIIVDDYTKYCWVLPLSSKADFKHAFHSFVLRIENLLSHSVTTIRTGNGGEFINEFLAYFCIQQGITHEKTCSHTSIQSE